MPRHHLDLNMSMRMTICWSLTNPRGSWSSPTAGCLQTDGGQAGAAYPNTQAAATGMLQRNRQHRVVHRLDRDTSGVLILAKSDRVHAALSQQFERGTVLKLPRPGQWPGYTCRRGICLPIGPHPQRPGMMVIERRQGKSAVTRYAAVERFRGYTLWRCGRKPGAAIKFACMYRRSAIRWPSTRSMALANPCYCRP